MPNAGYYSMQNACEPVHIQLNPIDLKVSAINRSYKKSIGLTATVDILGIDSKSIFHEEKNVDLTETDVKETNSLAAVLSTANGVNFVVLNLKNSSGKIISHNVYWLSKGDYKSLNDMPATSVVAKVLSTNKGNSETSWTIQIENKTDKMAFFIRPQLISGEDEVLPSYWTANYISLAPSESASIIVSCPNARLNGKGTSIRISGWNVTLQNLKIN